MINRPPGQNLWHIEIDLDVSNSSTQPILRQFVPSLKWLLGLDGNLGSCSGLLILLKRFLKRFNLELV